MVFKTKLLGNKPCRFVALAVVRVAFKKGPLWNAMKAKEKEIAPTMLSPMPLNRGSNRRDIGGVPSKTSDKPQGRWIPQGSKGVEDLVEDGGSGGCRKLGVHRKHDKPGDVPLFKELNLRWHGWLPVAHGKQHLNIAP